METILGIDLGTTNSVASIIRGGQVEVLGGERDRILPSVVGLDAENNLLVGHPARNQWTLAPERTVRSIKRKMGANETVQLGDQSYAPQEISAIIVRTLKERAERQLGESIPRAVITVPAFFNEQQREATREAGQLAGFDVARIINEPTAASLTYNSTSEGMERLLVYDLGGGTFDVSIVQVEDGVVEVLASHGDTQLGGDDFDELLLDDVCDKFQEETDVDLRQSLTTKSRVLRAVEEAKQRLSFDAFTMIEEEFIAEKAGVPLHLKMELARHEYEDLIEPLLSKTLVCIDEALSDAKLAANQIDRVILVGGASRTPMVHELLREQLGQPIHLDIDPDLCVSMGAAIQGGLISGAEVGQVLIDITPHTLGVACHGILHGLISDYRFASLIQRNTALPASRSEVFYTEHDNQESVLIQVYQGEDDDVRHNQYAGEFELDGLVKASRGQEILIRFDLDLDGLLKVTAIEKATGLENHVTIDNALSQFQSEGREAAKARIEAAFSDAGDRAPEQPLPLRTEFGETPELDLPPELEKAIREANELIAKSREVVGTDANPVDVEDMRQTVEKLESAVADRDLDRIEPLIEELDNLVFYMQDS